MILIVARTHQEAVNWCRENGINPRDPNYRIAVRRQDLEGLRPEKTKIVSFPAGVSVSDIARLSLQDDWDDPADTNEGNDLVEFASLYGIDPPDGS